QAEALIYSSEKALREAGDKVAADIKDSVGKKIDNLKNALKGDDVAQIKSALGELTAEIQRVGEALYNVKKESDNEPPPSN
ncbi:MAG: Heat shock protein 70, partial [Candidatus Jorgensenbacteria bacterium GW2011_GWC1_48_8]